jgi:hypothetical protein
MPVILAIWEAQEDCSSRPVRQIVQENPIFKITIAK